VVTATVDTAAEDRPPPTGDRPARWADAAALGAALVVSALGIARLVAAVASTKWPVATVGDRVVDGAPRAVKDWAIRTFGTGDKPALQVGIVVVLAALAVGVGRLALGRRAWGAAAIAAFTVVGVLAVRRGVDGTGAYLPPLLGGAAALAALHLLVRAPRPAAAPHPFDRRRFLTTAAGVSAASVAAGALGVVIDRSRTGELARSAARLRLPAVAAGAAAQPVPRSASAGHGASPFITPNGDFYRIDTALITPSVDLASWRLRIHGMVDHPMELDFDALTRREVVERVITLCCVSNEVGGPYVGTTRWLGVPLAPLLDEVGVHPAADQLASTSADGWTCGFPTELARDGRDAMIAIGMDGDPLPIAHGFPARLVVPGLYGYVSATKWLTEIRLTTFDDFEGYWIPRGWSRLGPVKTQSRIDVPHDQASVAAGPVVVAGVAWAQHRGIDAVEVRIDDGPWRPAEVATEVSIDAWRQWTYRWDASPGDHTIAVRATDGTGRTQTGRTAPVAPNGATGWHTIDVTVDR
jgi:DMSO/TMAO reductase YedYZ molybdopterin-dependent catalytic subunit